MVGVYLPEYSQLISGYTTEKQPVAGIWSHRDTLRLLNKVYLESWVELATNCLELAMEKPHFE